MVSLAGIVGTNALGLAHKFTKVNRAIYRTNFGLLNQALNNQRWDVLQVSPGNYLDVVWGNPDYDRLSICFDRITRGVFYYERGERFPGETRLMLGFTDPPEGNPTEFRRFIRDKVELELEGKERRGANPEVFYYQFTDADQFGFELVRFVFYGGLDIYVALIPPDGENFGLLETMLIEQGIDTTISLGDKIYRFNATERRAERPASLQNDLPE